MWKPKICNCLIWALYMLFKYHGGIKAYKSHYGWWPHFLWEAPDGITWEYVPPVKVKLKGWKQIFPLRIFLFKGVIRQAGVYKEISV